MKYLLIVTFILGLFACKTDTVEPNEANSGSVENKSAAIGGGKIYTSFGKTDLVNKLLTPKLSNATQAQVDLKDLVQRKKDFTIKPLVTVDQFERIFPENLANMTRKSFTGEINSLLISPATFVKAEYRLGNNIARISCIDSGAHPGVIVGIANWADRIIDKKEDVFEEHTRTFGGYPAYERVIFKSNANTFEYIVDNRWIIQIQALKIPIEKVYELAGSINIDKLRSLAKG